MRHTVLFILLFTLITTAVTAQTTSFKDSRWFDYKKYSTRFYSNPVHESAEVVVSDDSIIVYRGSIVEHYKVKSVSDIITKTKKDREFMVDLNGVEAKISISRSAEEYFGKKRQIAWISGPGWIILVPLTSIAPLGYLFPGDTKIDIDAERTRIVGYYDYDLMRKVDAEAYERAGAHSYDFIIWTDDKCKKDIQIELRTDNTGTWWLGQTAKDCSKKLERNFKWKLEQVVEEGRRKMMLTLIDDVESNQYIIDELTDKKLTIKGEFNLGDSDTTTTAFLSLKRKKKK